MKKLFLLCVILTLFSCKKESQEPFGTTQSKKETQKREDLGAEIFNAKGACAACHQPEVKMVGPSLQVIAKIYKEKNGNMVAFFKGEKEAIVEPAQYELMKANVELTKTFTEEELKALEEYVYSFLK